MSPAIATALGATLLLCPGVALLAQATRPAPIATRVTVHVDQVIAHVEPDRDWGAALDGHDFDATSKVYTPANIAAMLSAGLRPITYRLRTELGIETWHWNPAGHWSDPARQQGYWISDDSSTQPIITSFGYRLPRRGRTIDDGNNDGYSRIDDGDTTSFWKTNPYLDPRFTHDSGDAHAQWFTIDFGDARPVSEVRLLWGDPYPRRYDVEYWSGDQSLPIDDNPDGHWRRFAHGTVADGHGGAADLVVSEHADTTRFLRVVMYQSSHTAADSRGDPRDSLGYALREVFAGTRDDRGVFHDAVRHDTLAARQSAVLVSSTDPWHRAIDLDSETTQPGFDLVYRSGLTNHLPMLLPTGLLFDTPENAVAELRFLERRGYPIAGLELGEEPDGQRVTPEDYGALYLQFASALRQVDSHVALGGPSMQTLLNDELAPWPDRASPGSRSGWMGRFLDYLDTQHGSADYQFFSFEWYPFDDVCDNPANNLADAPGLLARDLASLTRSGVPESLPRIMTEYGYSAHLATAEVTLPGALFDADAVADFFAHGGTRSYYFGYEPATLAHEPSCPHWGNLVMFLADSHGKARYRMPRYYAARLLTHAWADSTGGEHVMAATEVLDVTGHPDSLLSAYALHRPDHRWSLLLVNRDARRSRTVTVRLDADSVSRALRGPVDVWQYSSVQYRFIEHRWSGHPVLDRPPTHHVSATLRSVALPAYSITVITGR